MAVCEQESLLRSAAPSQVLSCNCSQGFAAPQGCPDHLQLVPPAPPNSMCIWKTRTDPARIVVLCYAFLMLTLALVYIANTSEPHR